MIFPLISDFADALNAMPREHPRHRTLKLLDEAIRRDVHFIDRHPTTLFQCLWNTCWWYDCPEAAGHYDSFAVGKSIELDPWERPGPRLASLLEDWRIVKDATTPGFTWARSLRPPSIHLGTAQTGVFDGRGDRVKFSLDGSRVFSNANVWDAFSGQQLSAFAIAGIGTVREVAFSRDGSEYFLGTTHGIGIWNATSGQSLGFLSHHPRLGPDPKWWNGRPVVANIAFWPEGRRVVTQIWKPVCRVWDLDAGEEVARFPGGGEEPIVGGPVGTVHSLGLGKKSEVDRLVLSPDGQLLARAMRDQTIRINEISTGRERHCLAGPTSHLESLCFSSNGRWLVSCEELTIRAWDLGTGQLRTTMKGLERTVYGAAITDDGKLLLSCSMDQPVLLWDVDSGKQLGNPCGSKAHAKCVAFFPGDRQIAVAGGRAVQIWGLDPGEKLRSMVVPTREIVYLAVSPDGRWIAAAEDDNKVHVWNAHTGETVLILKCQVYGFQGGITFSPQGDRISVWTDESITVWEVPSGRPVAWMKGNRLVVDGPLGSSPGWRIAAKTWEQTLIVWEGFDGRVVAELATYEHDIAILAWSPDGEWLVSGGTTGAMCIWDARSGQSLIRWTGPPTKVISLVWASDGTKIASGHRDKTVRVWDVANGGQIACFPALGREMLELKFSPNGRLLATGITTPNMHLWEIDSGRELLHYAAARVDFSLDGSLLVLANEKRIRIHDLSGREQPVDLVGHEDWVSDVAVSPDGRWIVSGSKDHTIRLWKVKGGETLRRVLDHANHIVNSDFSPDGRWIASGGWDNKVFIWDAQTGILAYRLDNHKTVVTAVDFSADNRWLVTGDSSALHVWEVGSFRQVARLEEVTDQGKVLGSVIFSRDGQRMVSSPIDDESYIVWVWSTRDGSCLARFEGHRRMISSLAFSPNGCLVASGSIDTTVRIWDVDGKRSLGYELDHDSHVNAVVFSPDGTRIACSSLGLSIWDVETGNRVARSRPTNEEEASVIPSQFEYREQHGKCIRIRDRRIGNEVAYITLSPAFQYGMTYSYDGRWIFIWSHGLRVWDAKTSAFSGMVPVAPPEPIRFLRHRDWEKNSREDEMIFGDTATGAIVAWFPSILSEPPTSRNLTPARHPSLPIWAGPKTGSGGHLVLLMLEGSKSIATS